MTLHADPQHASKLRAAETAGEESATLACFAAGMRFEDLPASVIARAVELFVDWGGSALSGKGKPAIVAIERLAETMGPSHGPAEILVSRRSTSPLFRRHGQCGGLAHFRTGRRA